MYWKLGLDSVVNHRASQHKAQTHPMQMRSRLQKQLKYHLIPPTMATAHLQDPQVEHPYWQFNFPISRLRGKWFPTTNCLVEQKWMAFQAHTLTFPPENLLLKGYIFPPLLSRLKYPIEHGVALNYAAVRNVEINLFIVNSLLEFIRFATFGRNDAKFLLPTTKQGSLHFYLLMRVRLVHRWKFNWMKMDRNGKLLGNVTPSLNFLIVHALACFQWIVLFF